MKYRNLPRTDLLLSEVGFGVWTVATNWWGRIPEEMRRSLLEEALELGINFFDTADTYGEGYGEEVLAKFMGHRRHEMIIATKFGYDFYDTTTPRIGHQERPQKFEPEFIRFACEQSLRRLNTDYIDLYQLHNPRVPAIESDEVFETLEDLKHEGKIRFYGSALGPISAGLRKASSAWKSATSTASRLSTASWSRTRPRLLPHRRQRGRRPAVPRPPRLRGPHRTLRCSTGIR